VKNRAPIFSVQKPPKNIPEAKHTTPTKQDDLAPIFLIILALTKAKKEIIAALKLPTKLSMAGVDNFSFTKAA